MPADIVSLPSISDARLVEAIINENNCAIQTDWLAYVVMGNHKDIKGADRDFYILCAWHHVKRAIRAVVRKYKPTVEDEPDQSMLFPGYQRLQVRYHIEREHESYLVPIDELSDGELDTKAAEYEAMAEGCHLHAAELRRYRLQRHPNLRA